MADEFFAAGPSLFKGYDITQDQLSAMEAFIHDEVTLEDAIKQLISHTTAASSPLEMQQRLSGLWTLLNETAVALPSAQPKIIAILQSIRKLPEVDVPRGEGEDFIDLDDGFIWRELTGWANNWADTYNYYGSRFVIESYPPEEHAARKTCWISANAYTARLAATGEPQLSSYGAALDRATRVMVDTLEVDHGDSQPRELEAAAQLFKHAASELYGRSQQKSSPISLVSLRSSRTGKPPMREQFCGQEGYSTDVWNAWKESWALFSSKESFSGEARAAAHEAFVAMEETES
ncbi:hypothetical protein O1611_g5791 [Lasiodiplodia mahajangana]|uniref:Uncharacterized protein n=1 Tax=Lasiodiplodia mahajangana TaxID=1108764 RepID=A0ACC2JKT3_9PEZI|nr:hypothetical protein O1611_g5791 [Lasiodiplodia mahajangana]